MTHTNMQIMNDGKNRQEKLKEYRFRDKIFNRPTQGKGAEHSQDLKIYFPLRSQ